MSIAADRTPGPPSRAVERRPAHAARAAGGALRRRARSTLAALGRRVQAHGRTRARGRRRDRRRRPRRRPAGLLLRAGPVVPRRLARRGARRDDRPRAAARRPRRRAGRRLHRVRRRAHAGGPRRPRRLRPHLPRARRAVGPRPADLRDLRRARRRRLLLARADRLRRDDRARRDVPHRPRRRARGHGRGRQRRRRSAATRSTSATASPTSSPTTDDDAAMLVARPARPPAGQLAASARRAGAPAEPGRVDPAEAVPDRRAPASTTCATSSAALVDGGRLLESAPRWARNMVCGFARLEGRAVGVIANQPHYLGGVLDADSGTKGARFVRTCNAFGLPLVVLVDTPGFMPGTRAGAGRRDPPRRQARARVRRGRRCRR